MFFSSMFMDPCSLGLGSKNLLWAPRPETTVSSPCFLGAASFPDSMARGAGPTFQSLALDQVDVVLLRQEAGFASSHQALQVAVVHIKVQLGAFQHGDSDHAETALCPGQPLRMCTSLGKCWQFPGVIRKPAIS